MIAARRYMAGRWYMPEGVHDLWGIDPVRYPPRGRWGRDWSAESALAGELNDAFEAAERKRCLALRQNTPPENTPPENTPQETPMRKPTPIIDVLTARLPEFIANLKARVGGTVLYVKDAKVGYDEGVHVSRMVLWSVETTEAFSYTGDGPKVTTRHHVTLFPDAPTWTLELDRMRRTGGQGASSALLALRVDLDGPEAERSVLLSYAGLDDRIGDCLGYPLIDAPGGEK